MNHPLVCTSDCSLWAAISANLSSLFGCEIRVGGKPKVPEALTLTLEECILITEAKKKLK